MQGKGRVLTKREHEDIKAIQLMNEQMKAAKVDEATRLAATKNALGASLGDTRGDKSPLGAVLDRVERLESKGNEPEDILDVVDAQLGKLGATKPQDEAVPPKTETKTSDSTTLVPTKPTVNFTTHDSEDVVDAELTVKGIAPPKSNPPLEFPPGQHHRPENLTKKPYIHFNVREGYDEQAIDASIKSFIITTDEQGNPQLICDKKLSGKEVRGGYSEMAASIRELIRRKKKLEDVNPHVDKDNKVVVSPDEVFQVFRGLQYSVRVDVSEYKDEFTGWNPNAYEKTSKRDEEFDKIFTPKVIARHQKKALNDAMDAAKAVAAGGHDLGVLERYSTAVASKFIAAAGGGVDASTQTEFEKETVAILKATPKAGLIHRTKIREKVAEGGDFSNVHAADALVLARQFYVTKKTKDAHEIFGRLQTGMKKHLKDTFPNSATGGFREVLPLVTLDEMSLMGEKMDENYMLLHHYNAGDSAVRCHWSYLSSSNIYRADRNPVDKANSKGHASPQERAAHTAYISRYRRAAAHSKQQMENHRRFSDDPYDGEYYGKVAMTYKGWQDPTQNKASATGTHGLPDTLYNMDGVMIEQAHSFFKDDESGELHYRSVEHEKNVNGELVPKSVPGNKTNYGRWVSRCIWDRTNNVMRQNSLVDEKIVNAAIVERDSLVGDFLIEGRPTFQDAALNYITKWGDVKVPGWKKYGMKDNWGKREINDVVGEGYDVITAANKVHTKAKVLHVDEITSQFMDDGRVCAEIGHEKLFKRMVGERELTLDAEKNGMSVEKYLDARAKKAAATISTTRPGFTENDLYLSMIDFEAARQGTTRLELVAKANGLGISDKELAREILRERVCAKFATPAKVAEYRKLYNLNKDSEMKDFVAEDLNARLANTRVQEDVRRGATINVKIMYESVRKEVWGDDADLRQRRVFWDLTNKQKKEWEPAGDVTPFQIIHTELIEMARDKTLGFENRKMAWALAHFTEETPSKTMCSDTWKRVNSPDNVTDPRRKSEVMANIVDRMFGVSPGVEELVKKLTGKGDVDPVTFVDTMHILEKRVTDRHLRVIDTAVLMSNKEEPQAGYYREVVDTWFKNSSPVGLPDDTQVEGWESERSIARLRLARLFGKLTDVGGAQVSFGDRMAEIRDNNLPNPYAPFGTDLINDNSPQRQAVERDLMSELYRPGGEFKCIGDAAKKANPNMSPQDVAKNVYIYMQVVGARYRAYGDVLLDHNSMGSTDFDNMKVRTNEVLASLRDFKDEHHLYVSQADQTILNEKVVSPTHDKVYANTTVVNGLKIGSGGWMNQHWAIREFERDSIMRPLIMNVAKKHDERRMGTFTGNVIDGAVEATAAELGIRLRKSATATPTMTSDDVCTKKENQALLNFFQDYGDAVLLQTQQHHTKAKKKFNDALARTQNFDLSAAKINLMQETLMSLGQSKALVAHNSVDASHRVKHEDRIMPEVKFDKLSPKEREVFTKHMGDAIDDFMAARAISRNENPELFMNRERHIVGSVKHFFAERFDAFTSQEKKGEDPVANAMIGWAHARLGEASQVTGKHSNRWAIIGADVAGAGAAAVILGSAAVGTAVVSNPVGWAVGAAAVSAATTATLVANARFAQAKIFAKRAQSIAAAQGLSSFSDEDFNGNDTLNYYEAMRDRRWRRFAADTLNEHGDNTIMNFLKQSAITKHMDASAMDSYRQAMHITDPVTSRQVMHGDIYNFHPNLREEQVLEHLSDDTFELAIQKRKGAQGCDEHFAALYGSLETDSSKMTVAGQTSTYGAKVGEGIGLFNKFRKNMAIETGAWSYVVGLGTAFWGTKWNQTRTAADKVNGFVKSEENQDAIVDLGPGYFNGLQIDMRKMANDPSLALNPTSGAGNVDKEMIDTATRYCDIAVDKWSERINNADSISPVQYERWLRLTVNAINYKLTGTPKVKMK